jgi:secreted trypsin-like serine protease
MISKIILITFFSILTLSISYANNEIKSVNNTSNHGSIKIWDGNIVKNFQDYPYIASINQNNAEAPYESHYCAGTFISHYFVLTAGHCVTKQDGSIISPQEIAIYYGGLNLKTSHFYKIPVTHIYRYPTYSSGVLGLPNNDLALIQISPPEGISIQTVILPNPNSSNLIDDKNIVRAIGWGFYKPFSPVSPELRYANQNIKSKTSIGFYLNSLGSPYSSDMFNTEEMTGTFSPDGKRITQGDSGGPLLQPIYFFGWKYIQIGITSWGPEVSLDKVNASFYTNLNNKIYLKWINSIVNSLVQPDIDEGH